MASGSLVYLVRHGESVGNVTPGLRRRDDPPLTERGRAQAARAAEALAGLGIGALFSSPLRRARETAEIIGAATGAGIQVAEGFREVDMGALSDSDAAEDRALRDAIFSAWLAGDYRRSFPGGEDFPAVIGRAREELRRVLAEAGAPGIAVVTHRMPIAAAAALCEGGAARAPGGCPNGAITVLEPRDGGRWRLVAWGDARHLA